MSTTQQPPNIPPAVTRKVLTALEKNWQAEKSGYHTYETLASREHDPVRKEKLHHLAEAELHNAQLWEQRIRELGGPEPKYDGSSTGDADSLANRIGGPDMALLRLELDESRDIDRYGRQLKELGDAVDASSKDEIEAAIKEVRESLTSDDAAEINAKTEALQSAFHKVSEAMYQRAQEQATAGGPADGADGAGAPHTNGAGAEEDVVDAEVVDEK